MNCNLCIFLGITSSLATKTSPSSHPNNCKIIYAIKYSYNVIFSPHRLNSWHYLYKKHWEQKFCREKILIWFSPLHRLNSWHYLYKKQIEYAIKYSYECDFFPYTDWIIKSKHWDKSYKHKNISYESVGEVIKTRASHL